MHEQISMHVHEYIHQLQSMLIAVHQQPFMFSYQSLAHDNMP